MNDIFFSENFLLFEVWYKKKSQRNVNVEDQDSMLISCLFFAELVTISGFIKLHKGYSGTLKWNSILDIFLDPTKIIQNSFQ